jgi:PTH1 family peptidyl-tRNA hydrolase
VSEPFLIVGLGNPGREYASTRHNVGFRIADRLAKILNARYSRVQNGAVIASSNRGETKVILAKPQTFMNSSGRAVSSLVRFYKVPPGNLLVCCDDIDLPYGTIRLRASGGSAGQRGMQSILESLGTKDVPRLRFGIGRPPGKMDAADYVLQDFNSSQEDELPPIIATAAEAVLAFIDSGLEKAMTRYNAPPPNSLSRDDPGGGKKK